MEKRFEKPQSKQFVERVDHSGEVHTETPPETGCTKDPLPVKHVRGRAKEESHEGSNHGEGVANDPVVVLIVEVRDGKPDVVVGVQSLLVWRVISIHVVDSAALHSLNDLHRDKADEAVVSADLL